MGRGKGTLKVWYRGCFDCETTWGASISKNRKRPTWAKCKICGHSIGYLHSSNVDFLNCQPFNRMEYHERAQIEYGIAWGVN